MATQKADKTEKPERESRSYLQAISSFSPWASRTASPAPGERVSKDREQKKEAAAALGDQQTVNVQRGGDHKISRRQPSTLKKHHYPRDCPKLDVQWFHAVDVPKRKPDYVFSSKTEEGKEPPEPKKWLAFSKRDTKCIEAAWQTLSEQEDKAPRKELSGPDVVDLTSGDLASGTRSSTARSDKQTNSSIEAANDDDRPTVKVPVNEDYLFDVDVERRELGPAFWLGPIYEVRRGTWFYAEGSTMRPCDENLATQLEEGYLKAKPWRQAQTEPQPRSKSQARPVAERTFGIGTPHKASKSTDTAERGRGSGQTDTAHDIGAEDTSAQPESAIPATQRLFGPHSNWNVTYQGPSIAWLLSDDFVSRMSSAVFSRFVGAGTKVVRGYIDTAKRPATKDGKTSSRSSSPGRKDETGQESRRSSKESNNADITTAGDERAAEQESRLRVLERQMSNLVTSSFISPAQQDEEERRREEQEMMDDYRDTPNDPQDRKIEHLVLVTHGIGQRLGARFETFNFIHDVNELRKTLKAVYGGSGDLQALNDEVDKLPQNCRVQVLPVVWRHLLDFPKHSLKHNRKEYDLGDDTAEDDDKYPSLQDITVEGVPALRNIVADLALDILLYQTPAYKDHIATIVAKEANRIYSLFKQRNPYFQGNVSMIGHSLGSAIMFDILCDQAKEKPSLSKVQRKRHSEEHDGDVKLDFDVVNMFCLGSPIGLFSMLKGKTIASRRKPNLANDEQMNSIQPGLHRLHTSTSTADAHLDAFVSAPKSQSLYNIFHPSDPIAYRLEPLVSPAMASLKPQVLPVVKRSWLSAPAGVTSRLGQSVTGFWTSMSSGFTDRLIHRTLGLSAEDAQRLGAPAPLPAHFQAQMSQGAGTNIVAGSVISPDAPTSDAANEGLKRKLTQDTAAALAEGAQPPTLIDAGIETLYSGFHKRQKNDADSTEAEAEAAETDRSMRREEAKLRALNRNGRVDYSIQE